MGNCLQFRLSRGKSPQLASGASNVVPTNNPAERRFPLRFTLSTPQSTHPFPIWHTSVTLNSCERLIRHRASFAPSILQVCEVSKVITMADRNPSNSGVSGVRDRRYAIRFPFAADVELIDLESGKQVEGVTSDISLGGCFVCTSKPLPMNARARLKLVRKGQVLEALVAVRIVKPRIGMGIEFFDLEPAYSEMLTAWLDALRQSR